jgi:hypothetical protein
MRVSTQVDLRTTQRGAMDEINAEGQAYVGCQPRYVKWISKIRCRYERQFKNLSLTGTRGCQNNTPSGKPLGLAGH